MRKSVVVSLILTCVGISEGGSVGLRVDELLGE